MKTYKITKNDLDSDNFYKGSSDFDGNVEADKNLGWVKFKVNFITKGYIHFEAGSGIEAGLGIKAGEGIKAGSGILCKTISSKLRIFAGLRNWKLPEKAEMEIRCEKLIEGQICFGNLVITVPVAKIETIQVGSLTFNKAEVEAALKNLKSLS